jgi:DNA-binding transcriptional LysR family regulator
MDYRYLKAFIYTARHCSFSKAAEELKIAQSAVSRQIKLLEESLNEELIIRSSKKVLLTQKGKELFVAAQHFDKLTTDIFDREDSHPINIGILHGLLKNWFNPILVRYYKKNVRPMNIRILDQPQLKEGIEQGKFDLIFTTENIQSELITSLKIFDEKLVLISKNEINRKTLHQYKWIVYGEGDNLYKISRKKSDCIITVDSITTIVNLVKNNIGIAVVPDHVLKKNHSLVVSEVSGLPKSEIYMTTLNYKVMPGHIKEMIDLIKSHSTK